MPSDPREIFDAAFAAIRSEDWLGLAGLCDDASLAAFAGHMRRQLDTPPLDRERVLEGFMRQYPDMPRDVAEYNAEAALAASDARARLREDFPTLDSVEELRSLSATSMFALWCAAQSHRHAAEEAVGAGKLTPKHAEEMLDRLRSRSQFVLLGVVPDGDRAAHIIYRHRLPSEPDEADSTGSDAAVPLEELAARSRIAAEVCHWSAAGEWRLLARPGLFGLGTTLLHFGDDLDNDAA